MDLGLDGKVALVTGAGSGIGAGIAAALADEGCVVYLGDSNAGAAARVAAGCKGPGHPLTLDVGDPVLLRQCAEQIAAEQGRIDILVNNAGILKTGPAIDATIEARDQDCRVPLSAVDYCCKAVLPFILQRQPGEIVHLASVCA